MFLRLFLSIPAKKCMNHVYAFGFRLMVLHDSPIEGPALKFRGTRNACQISLQSSSLGSSPAYSGEEVDGAGEGASQLPPVFHNLQPAYEAKPDCKASAF